MKLFCIVSVIPFPASTERSTSAVNVVLYGLLSALQAHGHEIILQCVFNTYRQEKENELRPSEMAQQKKLEASGFKILPLLFPRDYQNSTHTPASKLKRFIKNLLLQRSIADFYPSLSLRSTLDDRIKTEVPQAILTFWSPEGVAATHGITSIPRLAYHGDADDLVRRARFKDAYLFDSPSLKKWPLVTKLNRFLELVNFRKAHLELMRKVTLVANVTASNSEHYSREGLQNSIYVRNTWPDSGTCNLDSAPSTEPIKIIGHFGSMGGTGSTYGLKYLLVDLMPELEKEMAGMDFQIHIIGDGKIVPALEPYLKNKRIVMRGFVEDLDSELKTSQVVLVLNNSGPLLAAFTRHLVVWSMGLCLVAHERSKLAIPEMIHLENVLMGKTPSDLAKMVKKAVTDENLNRHLRMDGRATFEKYFSPQLVAERLHQEIIRLT